METESVGWKALGIGLPGSESGCPHTLPSGEKGCKSRGWLEGGCGEVVGGPFPQDLGAGTGQVCVQVL